MAICNHSAREYCDIDEAGFGFILDRNNGSLPAYFDLFFTPLPTYFGLIPIIASFDVYGWQKAERLMMDILNNRRPDLVSYANEDIAEWCESCELELSK